MTFSGSSLVHTGGVIDECSDRFTEYIYKAVRVDWWAHIVRVSNALAIVACRRCNEE